MYRSVPCVVSCVLFGAGLAVTRAPTTPAAPTAPATPAAKETVVLNPFLVNSSADTGYAATNTLDGSRLNTALRDTPTAISVFTKDFLDDIGATDLSTLLRYDLSSNSSSATRTPRAPGRRM